MKNKEDEEDEVYIMINYEKKIYCYNNNSVKRKWICRLNHKVIIK